MSRILVIEDDAAYRMLIKMWLERAGHQVEVANNGRVGERMLRDDNFDVAITDIVMPDQEGIETIRGLRRDGVTTPILAMSGGGALDNTFYLRTAAALGASDTIEKPFTASMLLARIDRLVGDGEKADAGEVEAQSRSPMLDAAVA
jgi:DNA-binding response OmpR family regulator